MQYYLSKVMYKAVSAIVLTLLTLPVLSPQAVADILVVVNAKNPNQTLNQQDLRRIYMGRLKHFADGSPVYIGYQSPEKAVSETFCEEVTGKSMPKLVSLWAARLFSGKMEAPIRVDDDAAMLAWLAKEKNGIGYINSESLTDQVKVVMVIKE